MDDIDDTDLIKNLGVAGDAVALFIKLGKGFDESYHMPAEIVEAGKRTYCQPSS